MYSWAHTELNFFLDHLAITHKYKWLFIILVSFHLKNTQMRFIFTEIWWNVKCAKSTSWMNDCGCVVICSMATGRKVNVWHFTNRRQIGVAYRYRICSSKNYHNLVVITLNVKPFSQNELFFLIRKRQDEMCIFLLFWI